MAELWRNLVRQAITGEDLDKLGKYKFIQELKDTPATALATAVSEMGQSIATPEQLPSYMQRSEETYLPQYPGDLGKITVSGEEQVPPINSEPQQLSRLQRYSQEIPKGLDKFMSSMGAGLTGQPINMEGRGWESGLGGKIGATVGDELLNQFFYGQHGKGVQSPEFYNTPQQRWSQANEVEKARNTFLQKEDLSTEQLNASKLGINPSAYTVNGKIDKTKLFDAIAETSKAPKMSASRENAKTKSTLDVLSTIETANVRRNAIDTAMKSAERIDSGVYGQAKRGFLKAVGADSPALEDWQNIKMVLTDGQLLYTAKTKGAISDKEMELFAKAAANDDVASVRQIMPVLRKILRELNADETAKVNAYKRSYKEDPYSWEEVDSNIGQYSDAPLEEGATQKTSSGNVWRKK